MITILKTKNYRKLLDEKKTLNSVKEELRSLRSLFIIKAESHTKLPFCCNEKTKSVYMRVGNTYKNVPGYCFCSKCGRFFNLNENKN